MRRSDWEATLLLSYAYSVLLSFQVISERSSNISIHYFKTLLELCPLPGKETQSQNGWVVWKPKNHRATLILSLFQYSA